MAIVGDLSIETSDGTVLTASNDLALAWKWAEHEWGAQWAVMPNWERNSNVADALAALRAAYGTDD